MLQKNQKYFRQSLGKKKSFFSQNKNIRKNPTNKHHLSNVIVNWALKSNHKHRKNA